MPEGSRTVDEVYEKVLEVHGQVIEVAGNVLGLRSDFGDLKSHVNDELEIMSHQLDNKLSKSDLLESFLFQLFAHRWARYGAGAIAMSILATMVSSTWLPLVERIFSALGF